MSDKHIVRSDRPSYQIPDISVGQYVWNRIQQLNGNTVCVTEENSGSELTISQLISKSNAIAMALIDTGVQKTDIILSYADNIIEHSIVLFAASFLGIPIYPISSIANIYEMDTLLKTLSWFVLITSKSKLEIVDKVLVDLQNQINLKYVVVLDSIHDKYLSFDQLLENGKNRKLNRVPYFDVNPQRDTFVFLQSSGTSGFPKSVILSHKSFMATILHFANLKYVENPVFAQTTPFGFISGVTFLFSYVSLGIPLIIYKQISDDSIFRSIEKYRVSFMYFTPPFGYKFIDEQLVKNYDLSSLKYLFTGGSALAAAVGKAIVQKYGVILNEGYGMTEYFPMTDFPTAEQSVYIPGNVGKVAANTQIKVIDIKSGNSLGPNLEGEICCMGPKLFTGYLDNKSATDESIDSHGWLHSGDLGYYDQNYRLFITDRLKELIKYQTIPVYPSELEQFLLTHKCVAEVAVVGVKHVTDNQWPRAYVKLKPNMSVTEEELKKYVSDNLNEGKQLRAGVVFVDTIPRTTIGKVSRRYFKTLVAKEMIDN